MAPRVAVHPAGGFAVVWGSSDGASKTSTVRMQRYAGGGDPAGRRAGRHARAQHVHDGAAGDRRWMRPARSASPGARDTRAPGARPIQAQRFDAAGQPLGGHAHRRHDRRGHRRRRSRTSPSGRTGDFTVAWCGETGDAVRVRRFDANGIPFTRRPARSCRESDCDFPAVASLGRGPRLAPAPSSVFAVWSDAARSRVLLQRLDAATPIFPEPVALETPAVQRKRSGRGGLGRRSSARRVGAGRRAIYAQRLAPDGRALERPFAVSAGAPDACTRCPRWPAARTAQVAVAWRDAARRRRRRHAAPDAPLRQRQRRSGRAVRRRQRRRR